MSQSIQAFALGEITIRQFNGLFSLNDLHKAAGSELRRLYARVQELEASKEQREPLDEEAIERVTGVKQGTPMFLAATGFVRATEQAHGI